MHPDVLRRLQLYEAEQEVIQTAKALVLWWNEPETDETWDAWDEEHQKRHKAFEEAVWRMVLEDSQSSES